jgi:hypothetical protein
MALFGVSTSLRLNIIEENSTLIDLSAMIFLDRSPEAGIIAVATG